MSSGEVFGALCEDARTKSDVLCVTLYGSPRQINTRSAGCAPCSAVQNDPTIQADREKISDMQKEIKEIRELLSNLRQQNPIQPEEAQEVSEDIEQLCLEVETIKISIRNTEREIEAIRQFLVEDSEQRILQEARDDFRQDDSRRFYFGPVTEEEISLVGIETVPSNEHLTAGPTVLNYRHLTQRE